MIRQPRFSTVERVNWAHLHLALNHIPVLGTLFAFLLLCAAAALRNEEIKKITLWAFVLLTAVSVPIKFTGDFAAQSVAKEPWIEPSIVKAHEESADQATGCIFVLGLVSGAGLFINRRVKSVPHWLVAMLLIISAGTFLLMARTANIGGQIRHPEIRPGYNLHHNSNH